MVIGKVSEGKNERENRKETENLFLAGNT